VLCASFLLESSTGKYLLCKHCSTKSYWEVPCASFVVQSSTGKYFGQALQSKAVLEGSLVQALQYKSEV